MPADLRPAQRLASAGVPGLDEILIGGFERENLYLVEGTAGSGKTTVRRSWSN